MSLLKIINEEILKVLNENAQLADKVYFNTGVLNDDDKEIIYDITNGDNYTKIISDMCYFLKKDRWIAHTSTPESLHRELKKIHDYLLAYNKNVFPIEGFDIYNTKNDNMYSIYKSITDRQKIIDYFSKLPSIAYRNMKTDIRTPRNSKGFDDYLHKFEYFMGYYGYLANRDEKTKQKFDNKMFKNNTTIDDLMRFVDDKQEFLGGDEFTKEDIYKLSETEDFDVVFEYNNILIVDVYSQSGIRNLGCNSLWCFTYGKQLDQNWSNYSYNGMVHVIIDFNQRQDSEEFMFVLIRPLTDDNNRLIRFKDDDNYPLFNMANDNYYDPYSILGQLFGPQYKKIIKQYLNFGY